MSKYKLDDSLDDDDDDDDDEDFDASKYDLTGDLSDNKKYQFNYYFVLIILCQELDLVWTGKINHWIHLSGLVLWDTKKIVLAEADREVEKDHLIDIVNDAQGYIGIRFLKNIDITWSLFFKDQVRIDAKSPQEVEVGAEIEDIRKE